MKISEHSLCDYLLQITRWKGGSSVGNLWKNRVFERRIRGYEMF